MGSIKKLTYKLTEVNHRAPQELNKERQGQILLWRSVKINMDHNLGVNLIQITRHLPHLVDSN